MFGFKRDSRMAKAVLAQHRDAIREINFAARPIRKSCAKNAYLWFQILQRKLAQAEMDTSLRLGIFKESLAEAVQQRHDALRGGAASGKNPEWAAAAITETHAAAECLAIGNEMKGETRDWITGDTMRFIKQNVTKQEAKEIRDSVQKDSV